jgi:hypothetical protein
MLFIGLKPTAVYALAGIPFVLTSLHSLLNEIPKECGTSNQADIQVLLMGTTKLFLLFTGSPHLLLAERIFHALTVVAALQLYFSPAMVAWIYPTPHHFTEEKVIVHHINYFGWSTLVMSILGGALVWLDEVPYRYSKEEHRATMLFALAASLLLSVVVFSPLAKDSRLIVNNTQRVLFTLFITLGVGVTLMFL